MTHRKVRVNAEYLFYPVLLDRVRPAQYRALIPGDVVRVVNLPGAPKCNTMGHAHVNINGEFAGLVCTNSLYPITAENKKLVADAIRQDLVRLAAQPHAYVGLGNTICDRCGNTLNHPVHQEAK